MQSGGEDSQQTHCESDSTDGEREGREGVGVLDHLQPKKTQHSHQGVLEPESAI